MQDEEPEEGRKREQVVRRAEGRLGLWGSAQGLMSFLSSWAGPSPPPPPGAEEAATVARCSQSTQEAEAEPATGWGLAGHSPAGGKAVVRSSDPEPCRAEPSREVRSIIRMYRAARPRACARATGEVPGEGEEGRRGKGKRGGRGANPLPESHPVNS